MIHAFRVTREVDYATDLGLPARKGRVYWWEGEYGVLHCINTSTGEEVPEDIAEVLNGKDSYEFRTGPDDIHHDKTLRWSYYFRVSGDVGAEVAWHWAMSDVGDYANEYKDENGEWRALFG